MFCFFMNSLKIDSHILLKCENEEILQIRDKKVSYTYVLVVFYFSRSFKVSNINEDGEELEFKLNGFVAAFCVSLGLNCILIAIFVVKR